MITLLFQIKLVEVESVEWVNRKTYSVIALVLANRESKILLRAAQGLEDWFELLEVSFANTLCNVDQLLVHLTIF